MIFQSNFTSLWLLLMCSAATAQQRISGSVIDKGTRAPISAVTVRLESNLLASAVATATDADGRFSFAGLSPGGYTVSVSADTFYPQQVALTLGPRAMQQLSFELEPLATRRCRVLANHRGSRSTPASIWVALELLTRS